MSENTPLIDKILIRGRDHMAKHPNFRLVGRTEELRELQTLLMLKDSNGVILTGASGVGMSALARGLQSEKNLPSTPIDIVNKRFFWLDTDELFSSGNTDEINKTFAEIRRTLSQSPDTALIIENMGNFIEAANKGGHGHILNGLYGDVKRGCYQAVLECQYEDLGKVLKSDTDVRSIFTLKDLKEPKKDPLREIVMAEKKGYEEFHKIQISDEAINTALELTEKYKVRDLPAQPQGTLKLINMALAEYRHQAHSSPFKLEKMKAERAHVEAALNGGAVAPSLKDKSRNELESLQVVLGQQISEFEAAWEARHKEIEKVSRDQRSAEDEIRKLEAKIVETKEEEKKKLERLEDQHAGQPQQQQPQAAGKFNHRVFGEEMEFGSLGNVDSEDVLEMRRKITQYRQLAQESLARYHALTADINKDLRLEPDHILKTFSAISGIPVNKLTQDARAKLMGLDEKMEERVFGQKAAIKLVADAIRVSRTGLGDPEKPEASFIFRGPSGVGKTETVRVLADLLFDDPNAMVRLDMSEFMEKHAVSRLVGPPPGYEGHEEGGQLTNAIERNPNQIILFDEVEKAHKDVFDLLLQVIDAGRLTNGHGREINFKNTIIVLTTNIGANYFLDPTLSPEEADKLAEADMKEFFRAEFLNRFDGMQNIVSFRRLEMDNIIRIGNREVVKLQKLVDKDGLVVQMSPQDVEALCRDFYDPKNGARGIPGVFKTKIKSQVANIKLQHPGVPGLLDIRYDSAARDATVLFTQSGTGAAVKAAPAPANTI